MSEILVPGEDGDTIVASVIGVKDQCTVELVSSCSRRHVYPSHLISRGKRDYITEKIRGDE